MDLFWFLLGFFGGLITYVWCKRKKRPWERYTTDIPTTEAPEDEE